MTDKATLSQRSIARRDEPYRRFEEGLRKASLGILNDAVITAPTLTKVGDWTVHDSIVKHGSSATGTDQVLTGFGGFSVIDTRFNIDNRNIDIQTDRRNGLDFGIHPDDFISVTTISNHVVDGGKMSCVDHGTETTSDLVTLIRAVVSGTPPSLLSDMGSTVSTPEAVLASPIRSAAALSGTTKAALSLLQSASPAPSKYHGRAPATFDWGEGAVKTSGRYGTRARGFGGALLRFLNSLLTSTKTAKPASRGKRTMMTPTFWSGQPTEFARYERPHGRGGSGADSELEKRRHFPVE